MKSIPVTHQTAQLARRVVWFEPPEQALADPVRFLAYAMRYARHEDMKVIRSYMSDADLREALDRAPPGIIDPRSWAYWNSKMGRYPAPPPPGRTLAGGVDQEAAVRGPPDPEEVRARAREAWRARSGPRERS